MSLASRTAEWLMRHRATMPQWMTRAMESAARNPDGLIGRLANRALGGGSDSPNSRPPSQPVRVYIAPTNYAGQGFRWARALESADSRIGARNVGVVLPGGYGFAADLSVPIGVANGSDAWGRREWEAARRFTHVLIEAERPLFGRTFGRDVEREIHALEEAGLSVAYLCHGTDIRHPDRHAERHDWSPYPEDPRTDTLRRDAEANLALLDRVRRPTFVSTPDLLDDVPWAHWCPVVVDADAFRTDDEPFAQDTVRIVHASSSAVQKGSHRLGPALAPLIDHGEVAYEIVTATPAARMPVVYARADVVLDQFRLGSYGVAACEAMAAGRVVVGHVPERIRERVEREHGLALPIVEATTATLDAALRHLLADRDGARRIAAAGPEFVRQVHGGAASARVLSDSWIGVAREPTDAG